MVDISTTSSRSSIKVFNNSNNKRRVVKINIRGVPLRTPSGNSINTFDPKNDVAGAAPPAIFTKPEEKPNMENLSLHSICCSSGSGIGCTSTQLSLQKHFENLLRERGYPLDYRNTLDTGYQSNLKTPLQIASYGPRTIEIVKSGNHEALHDALVLGLDPNVCNQYGESLLHMACRRGNIKLLKVFMEKGALLQVSDDYGRTIMHDAMWAANPAFDVVETILRQDRTMLFLRDKRGSLPFSYVHKNDVNTWIDWFDQNIETYFPRNEAETSISSELALIMDNNNAVRNPAAPLKNNNNTGISLEIIQLVAYGELTPQEAHLVVERARNEIMNDLNYCPNPATTTISAPPAAGGGVQFNIEYETVETDDSDSSSSSTSSSDDDDNDDSYDFDGTESDCDKDLLEDMLQMVQSSSNMGI
mmetsp:Transcript_2700/g.3627  ORF Transcript_2700/g.3627 Transcript_2700/m.3627 type:complete len:417 (+) Transcript_2700:61-1311(+)|eukprot:CAMPEP_0198150016 /NCGR_PEP_ID=MMETSP1443-20131203/49033_1 /TAXON_ID=186043 /ORGANISM="Entomoneis sp., Strain CCMP2396" /LENGTH=416 /DNA_ID=CAMNT_0043815203 /DNA_START=14 /DNA_END=1264 /DNA_ORIENTATION=-